jgi:hypothetical protein
MRAHRTLSPASGACRLGGDDEHLLFPMENGAFPSEKTPPRRRIAASVVATRPGEERITTRAGNL